VGSKSPGARFSVELVNQLIETIKIDAWANPNAWEGT